MSFGQLITLCPWPLQIRVLLTGKLYLSSYFRILNHSSKEFFKNWSEAIFPWNIKIFRVIFPSSSNRWRMLQLYYRCQLIYSIHSFWVSTVCLTWGCDSIFRWRSYSKGLQNASQLAQAMTSKRMEPFLLHACILIPWHWALITNWSSCFFQLHIKKYFGFQYFCLLRWGKC